MPGFAVTVSRVNESAIYGTIHLDLITHKPTRDNLAKAAKMAQLGDTVWIVNASGDRLARIVAAEPAGTVDG